MYRTLYFRYSGQGKYELLEGMLYDGAITFFRHDQLTSAIDLAKLYVETLTKAGGDPTEDNFQRVCRLYLLIPPDNVDKTNYLSASLKWSSADGGVGDPRLHQHLAYGLWAEKEYGQSNQHFLHSRDGEGCGQMLAEYHTKKGLAGEVDLFIARAVLQFLCLKKHVPAATAFHSYTTTHPKIRTGPPYTLPLLNFLWLLLLSIQKSLSVSMYTVLCEQYRAHISREPSYLEYLDKIGQAFFGLPPPVRQPRNMFSGLMDQMMNAMNEEDSSDEVEEPRPGTSSVGRIGDSGRIRDDGRLETGRDASHMETADLD